jgi:hypothetical protein
MQVNRWLSVRLELLGISVVFGTAIFAGVLLPRSAGIAGLAITSALNLTGLLNWFVRTTTELEVPPLIHTTSFNPPSIPSLALVLCPSFLPSLVSSSAPVPWVKGPYHLPLRGTSCKGEVVVRAS